MAVLDGSSAQHMNSGAPPSPAAPQHDNPDKAHANGGVNDTRQGTPTWADINLGPSDEPPAQRSKFRRAPSLVNHVGRPPLQGVPEDIPMSRMSEYPDGSQGLGWSQSGTLTPQSTAHLLSRAHNASLSAAFSTTPPPTFDDTTTTTLGLNSAAQAKSAFDFNAVRNYGAQYLIPTAIHGVDATLMLSMAIATTTRLTGHVLTHLGWFIVCTTWLVAMLDILFVLLYNVVFFCLSPRTALQCRLVEGVVSVLVVLLQFTGGIYTTVQTLLGYEYAHAGSSYGPPSGHRWIATTELTTVGMSVCYFASVALWSCAGVYAITKGLDRESAPDRHHLVSPSTMRIPEGQSAMEELSVANTKGRVDTLQGLDGAQTAAL